MRFSKKTGQWYGRGLWQSVNAALEGVVHTLRSERNMRRHFFVGFLVLITGIYFNLQAVEFMLLCFAVSFVLAAEMFNTAVEHGVDLISEDYHPIAKIIKDIAAGAVFISAVNAAIVGYILFFQRVVRGWPEAAFLMVKQSSWHITMIALLVVTGLVLLIKMLGGRNQLLRGGMPSGHSALAFAVWVIASLTSADGMISFLVMIMAILIARTRVGIHTVWEVIAGSALGALVALLMFQFLS